MGILCGVGTAKCEVKELTFFQNWTSMPKGLNENVLKMMIIFKTSVYFNHFAVYSASWDLIQGL